MALELSSTTWCRIESVSSIALVLEVHAKGHIPCNSCTALRNRWREPTLYGLADFGICEDTAVLTRRSEVYRELVMPTDGVTLLAFILHFFTILHRLARSPWRRQSRIGQNAWSSTGNRLAAHHAIKLAIRLALGLELPFGRGHLPIDGISLVALIAQSPGEVNGATVFRQHRSITKRWCCFCTPDRNASLLPSHLANVVTSWTNAGVVSDEVFAHSKSAILVFAIVSVATVLLTIFLGLDRKAEFTLAGICRGWPNQVNTCSLWTASVAFAIVDVAALHIFRGCTELPVG
jgi:hypothetical protein